MEVTYFNVNLINIYINLNVCDDILNCPNDDSDETLCVFNQNKRFCYRNTTTSKLCYVDITGHFSKYFLLFKDNTNITSENNLFICNNNLQLDTALVNDLVADCGPEAEDEPILISLLSNYKFSMCEKPDEIPCVEGHSKCFDITNICTYRLNKYLRNFPCRNGGHLANCKEFECNLKFKCVDSYCIPWEYVCDGKWDCPRGHAETFKPACEDKHACANMYRCKNTNLRLHLGNVCDGENCPLGDDEILCELQQVKCPSDCFRF